MAKTLKIHIHELSALEDIDTFFTLGVWTERFGDASEKQFTDLAPMKKGEQVIVNRTLLFEIEHSVDVYFYIYKRNEQGELAPMGHAVAEFIFPKSDAKNSYATAFYIDEGVVPFEGKPLLWYRGTLEA